MTEQQKNEINAHMNKVYLAMKEGLIPFDILWQGLAEWSSRYAKKCNNQKEINDYLIDCMDRLNNLCGDL